MIELYAKTQKNIYKSSIVSTKTNTEFLYFYNNDKTDKEATYLEYNAIRLYKKGKIYLNDIFEETGEYEITFKIHYVNNTSTGGLYIRAVDVDGSDYTYAPLFENYFGPTEFQTDGTYTKKITKAGNNKDLFFAIDGDDDVYIYDINITTITGLINTHTTSIFNTTTVEPYYWLQLGVDEKADMVLSKSLKDIMEPDKIKSLYSQTFLLPATEINQKFFGYLNHNDSDPFFNVLTLQKCFLVVNGIDIGLGNLELKNIITTDTGSKYFNVLYKSDAIDIFTILTDKLLMNLETDFSIDTSISNIESLVSAYDNGKELVEANQDYSFGIMNRGKQMETGDYMNTFSYNSQEIANTKGLLGKDMIPVIPAKTILTNMFTNEGYTIDGSLFDDDIFKSLVVPLYSPIITNEVSEYDEQEIITPEFTHCLATVNSLVGRNIDGDFAVLGESYNVAHADEYQNFNYGRRPTLLYNSISILNTQPLGWWTLSPRKDQRTNIRITGEINVFGGALVSGSDFYDEYELDLYIVYPTTDGLHASGQKVKTWNNKLKWDNDEDEEDYLVIGDNTTTIDFLLPAVYLYKDETFSNDAAPFLKFKIKKIDTIGGSTGQEIQFRWDFNLKLESEVENIEFVYPDILQEPMLYLGDDELTQMKYIKTLTNMFNLYISVDKYEKIISFDIHNEFYLDDSYDLTEKIILDKKIDKKILSLITPRINNFLFKEYNLVENDKYFNDFNEKVGNLKYISDNEQSKIKSDYMNSSIFIFSKDKQMRIDSGSTDSVSFNMAEIKRFDDENNPILKNEYNIPFNFMFLNKATTASNMTLRDIELNTETIKPIIISNRNDVDNKFHLTYKTPKRVYTDINYDYDNLFTNYWKDYIGSFSDKNSYMLIAEFWLDALDFVKLKMNTLVRIQNELYFINKIKNWSPLKPTQIELYKLNKRNIGNTEPTEYIPKEEIPSGSDSININTDIIGVENTIIDLIDSSVNGDANTISNSSNLIVINDNNSIMSTSDSTISGENNIVNNSTNITMTSCEGVTLTNCSNLIITDEIGTSYINNVKVETGQQTNIMTTGGLNVTQEPFTDAGIIDSGEDEIYEDNWIDSMKKQDGNQ